MYIKVDSNGRLSAASIDYPLGDGEIELNAPEGFEMGSAQDWLIVDGVLVHDPLPEPVSMPTMEQRVTAVEQTQDDLVVMLADLYGGGVV